MRSPLSFLTGSRLPWPIARATAADLAARGGVAVVLIAAVFGLTRLDFQTARPDLEDAPGSGIAVRSEVTTLWLPQALLDLAQRGTGPPAVRSPEELRALLDGSGLGTAWYALIIRNHQVNGEATETTFIRRPRESPEHFGEFHDVMAAAAGRSPERRFLDFSHVAVEVVPDRLLGADPRGALAELTSLPVRPR